MNKLQGAFIGFGNIAEFGHWPTYVQSQDCEIVAVMDPSPRRQEAAKTLKPSLRTYSTAQELLQNERLDFVDICTPPSSHAELALQALDKNCHVLCEKPLTLRIADYAALSKAVAKSGRTVFTVHNWKFAPIVQKALSLIREGRIGSVWHVEIFTLRDNVCKGSSSAVQSEDWRKSAAIAGGGILIDHGWHAFYLLLHLIQASPQKMLAKMERPAPDSLEEVVQALVQFPEASGYIHLSWQAAERRNTLAIQGREGTLLIDDNRILLTTLDGGREEIRFDPALSAGSHHADWFKSLLPDFVEEVRTPAKRGANFREAGWCLALTQSAYDSERQGFKEIPVAFPGSPAEQPALA